MKWILLIPIFLSSCTSSTNYSNRNYSLQEDSITWEYDKSSLEYPSTYNSNNNILDSQDGSVQRGNPIGITLKY